MLLTRLKKFPLIRRLSGKVGTEVYESVESHALYVRIKRHPAAGRLAYSVNTGNKHIKNILD